MIDGSWQKKKSDTVQEARRSLHDLQWLPKKAAFFCITVTGQSLWARRSCFSCATSFLSRLTSFWWQHKTYSTTNQSQHAPSCHIITETNLWACLGYRRNPGWTGKWKTHRQGDIHVGEIIRLLLQRVNPQLSLLSAAGGGRPVSLQKTLPPLVRVHLCSSPPPASCWLSRGHLGEEVNTFRVSFAHVELQKCLATENNICTLLFLKSHKRYTIRHGPF